MFLNNYNSIIFYALFGGGKVLFSVFDLSLLGIDYRRYVVVVMANARLSNLKDPFVLLREYLARTYACKWLRV